MRYQGAEATTFKRNEEDDAAVQGKGDRTGGGEGEDYPEVLNLRKVAYVPHIYELIIRP